MRLTSTPKTKKHHPFYLNKRFSYPLLLIGLLFITNSQTFSQDSLGWYVKGKMQYMYVQQDMWAFRLKNDDQYTKSLNPKVVSKLVYRNDMKGKLNEIHFNIKSTKLEREAIKDKIMLHPKFDCFFPIITKHRKDAVSHKCFQKYCVLQGIPKWMHTNKDILVVFTSKPTQSVLQQFKNTYNLSLVHEPDPALPTMSGTTPINWTYVFTVQSKVCQKRTSASVSTQIYNNDGGTLVKIVEPWVEPNTSTMHQYNNLNSVAVQATNDPYYDDQWHIENIGQCLGGGAAASGTADADCDIMEAWNAGYTGSGVKVAVIDKGLYEPNHPDMNGQMLTGYDCIDGDADVTSNSSIPASPSHAQACAGLIGALGDNTIGTVGVAYDAQIVPYISWFGGAACAFQKAFAEDVDIISCSWGTEGWYSASVENEINNCRVFGRNGKGIIIFFSAGNNNQNTSTFFPGYLDDVIGIIASEQNDSRASFSNYGSVSDVAAPGTRVITTDLQGSNGYNGVTNNCSGASNLNNDYTYFAGTSAAAPIAAGVAAIVLSVEPQIPAGMGTLAGNNVGMEYILENTADKVGGYNYNAVTTGQSYEMGFGRINAYQAVLSGLSWDPNNKLVEPLGCGPKHFIEPHELLTYTINFQNVGTAPATLVILRDTIDSDLDISTLQLLGSKHPYSYQIISGNIIEWTFDPIYLPDLTVSEEDSKGYVVYSMLPKQNLAPGTELHNRAGIIFDQNVPVITNGVFHTISISPTPIASVIEGDQSICDGSSATFTASLGDSYQWSTGETTQSIEVTQAGIYRVRVLHDHACPSYANVVLTVEPNPSAFEIGMQCTSESYDFAYTGGLQNVSFFWDFGSNATPSTSFAENEMGVVFSTTGSEQVTLTISPTQGVCTSTTQTVDVAGNAASIGCGNNKIYICHKESGKPNETICVNNNALAQHLAHGDCIGPCDSQTLAKMTNSLGQKNEDAEEEQLQIQEIFEGHPNPFENTVTISFTLSKSESVELNVFSYMGQHITTLFDNSVEKGTPHSVQFEAKGLAEGIYMAVLQTATERKTIRLVVLR